jgi:ABC-type enterochelin transport system permease subunit
VLGAVVATGVLVWLALWLLMRHAREDGLRIPALWLVGITLGHVFLGIAAYMSRIVTMGSPQPLPVMVAFTVAHVAVGALTMAASVLLAIQTLRYVRKPVRQRAPAGVPAVS